MYTVKCVVFLLAYHVPTRVQEYCAGTYVRILLIHVVQMKHTMFYAILVW
jgi:hypothetical protein